MRIGILIYNFNCIDSNELQARLSQINEPSSKLLFKCSSRSQRRANQKVINPLCRVKSTENIQIVKPDPQNKNNTSNVQKKPFVEPGNPCEVFEEVISSTSVS